MRTKTVFLRLCSLALALLLAFSTVQPAFAASSDVSLAANTPYTIVCLANNKNVNVYCDKTSQIKNKTAVNLYKSSGDDTQKFTFSAQGGAYLIQPYKASGFTVNVSALKAGAQVYTYKNTTKNNEYWIVTKVSGGYAFSLKNAPSLYLTASGTKLTLAKYTGAKTQIFNIVAPATVTPAPTVTEKPTVTPVPQLAAPTVTISQVDKTIKVTWNKIAGSPRYMVYFKQNNGAWVRIGTTADTTYICQAAGLKNGSTYTFAVRCCVGYKNTNIFLSPYKASNSIQYYADLVDLAANTPYTMVNNSNNKNVNVYCDKVSQIKNKTTINLYKASGDDTQKFTFTAKEGAYLIQPYNASGYTLNVSARKAGAQVYAYKNTTKNNEYWIIKKVGTGYALCLKNAPSLYLTANGTKLTLAKYTGASTQIFTIAKVAAPAQTGNKTVSLKVPSISQTDSKWKNTEFVKGCNPKCTIGAYGCLLTCVTAVMSCKDGKTYRPDEYYKKLSFSSEGNLNWPKTFSSFKSFSVAALRKQLDKGNPVIVGGMKNGGHFVVVCGYKNYGQSTSDFLIMNPNGGKTSYTLAKHISTYGSSMRYLK